MGISTGFGRVELFDDFLGQALRGEWQEVTENSGTFAPTATGLEGGVAALTTGTTSGNRVGAYLELNFKAGTGSIVFEARVKSRTAITTRAIFIGFTDVATIENPIEIGASDAVTSNATNGVGFIYDTDAATDKWWVAGVKADVDTALTAVNLNGTQQAPVADQWQTFRIEINTDGDAVFGFGADTGSNYGCKEVARIANCVAPTALLVPVVLCETRTSGASIVDIDYIYVCGGRP